MKLCLTGASSFTGYWIARVLAGRGHHVVANFSGAALSYVGLRQRRIADLKNYVDCRFNVVFGTDAFLSQVRDEKPDILALHGAEVTNYRSWDFDPLVAAQHNTVGIRPLFEQLADHGGSVIATGTVFEPYEGVGDPAQRPFNPYGLSKHLSYEVFRMEAERVGITLSKFVIPNPFGVLEEPRFTSYLISEWAAGRVPTVGTPDYVRDNIHVDLLAHCYAVLVDRGAIQPGSRVRPGGYIETQGQFARRFAAAMEPRLGRQLLVSMAVQTQFTEPRIRVNDMPATAIVPSWSEDAAWNAIADYYGDRFATPALPSGLAKARFKTRAKLD
ncbi:MAG: NAD(P)-dependent oxidoreductase [Sphingomonas sp.]|jgi:nucleoside-diphosphate-sugar epimerase